MEICSLQLCGCFKEDEGEHKTLDLGKKKKNSLCVVNFLSCFPFPFLLLSKHSGKTGSLLLRYSAPAVSPIKTLFSIQSNKTLQLI